MPFMTRSGFKAAWKAYRPAPETAELRALRFRTMRWNAIAVVFIACAQLLSKLHAAAILIVVGVAVHAAAVTIRYWREKNHADREFAALNPESPVEPGPRL